MPALRVVQGGNLQAVLRVVNCSMADAAIPLSLVNWAGYNLPCLQMFCVHTYRSQGYP